MERVIFAEILDRRGHVQHRVRLDRFPARIGRAYTNDVILEDRHVSPSHASIELDEDGVVVRDLDSTNGLWELAPARRVASTRLRSDARIRVGRTVLRFREPGHEVETTLSDAMGPVDWITSHWTGSLFLLALAFGMSVFRVYRATYAEIEGLELVSGTLFRLMALAGWAGGWALVTRLLIHRTRFGAHWATICTYSIATDLLDLVMEYARFLFAPIVAVQLAEFGAGILLASIGLFAHLTIAGVLQPARRAAAALLVAGGILSVQQLDKIAGQPDWVSVLPYWSRLEPVDTAWLPARSVDRFFEDARSIQRDLEKLAAEED